MPLLLLAATQVSAFSYDVGPLQLTGFGLAVLLAFVISQIIAQRELERRGHQAAALAVPDLIFAAVIGTLIGAKIYYAALEGSLSALFTRAGFVFWGGFLGAVATTWWVIHRKKLRFTRISDVAGICIAAGYSVGRTGCWAVGDDYGRPWSSPFAVSFPNGAPPTTVGNMQGLFNIPVPAAMSPSQLVSVYPTQLFEVVLGFVIFAILWRMRDHKHAEGWLFGLYALLAGTERFFIEFLRAKDDRLLGPFTTAQGLAFAIALAGAGWMYLRWNTSEKAPGIHARAS